MRKVLHALLKVLVLTVLLVLLLTLGSSFSFAADRYAVASGNWNASIWAATSGGTAGSAAAPTSADAVFINNNRNVTVNITATCASLTILGGNSSSYITVSGSNSLTVSGSITINAGTGSGDNKYISVGAGSLTAGSVLIDDTGNDNRDSYISISTGTVTISGSITMNGTPARNQIVFTGAGVLNITGTGTITGGTISNAAGAYTALSRGTINYAGTNQSVGVYTYYNLILSGSGTKTISNGTSVSGNFQMDESATATPAVALAVSGTTTLSGTSLLTLGAANILSATPVVLDGGTLKTGATTGYSETVGTLSLTDNSTISLGTGNHTLTFANSSAATWTSGKVLTITGWQGSWNGTTGTAGKIFFGAAGLTTTQLSQIQFYNGTTNFPATILTTGELVPISVATGFWYKADAGVTGTSAVTAWADQSGNGNNANNSGSGTVSLSTNSINFNPSLFFTGVERQFFTEDYSAPLRLVVVTKPAAVSSGSNAHLAGLVGAGPDFVTDKGIRLKSSDLSWSGDGNADDWAYAGTSRINGVSASVHNSKWHIVNQTRGNALWYSQYYLGGYYAGRPYYGNIAEVIVYNSKTTPSDAIVESYLAIKYGITLPGNYYASDGTTIWTSTGGYQNDVHGIGRDNTGLNQLSSKSENPGTDVLTIQSGNTFTTPTSAQSGAALSDGQFFITGHNGASATTTATLSTGVTAISRRWYAQVNGSLPTESFQFNLTGASFGAYCKIGVLIADDASLTTNLRFAEGTLSSSLLTVNNAAISNNKYFTVATLANVTAGSISGAQTICYNTSPTTLTSGTDGTGFGTISYLWESSIDGTNWSAISGATSNTYSPGALTQLTYFRRTTVATLGGVSCNSASTSSIAITVRPIFTSGAIVTTGQSICSGGTPTIQIGSTTAASGGDNLLTYQWQYSTDNTFATGVTTVASNTATYTPTQILTQTTYYRRQVKDGTCNTSYTASSGVWQVTVNPLPQGSLAGSTICLGGTGQFTFISSSGTGPFTLVINGTTYTGVVSGTAFNANPNPGSTTAYTLTSITDANGCVRTSGITGTSATITVNTLSTAATSITGTSTICNGGGTTLSVSGGSLGTGASWKWYSGSCGGTSVGTGSSFTVSPTTTTTYYVRAEGTCNTTTCSSLSVTVNTLSTAPTSITGTSTICNGGGTTLSVLGGSLGTGASWKWYSDAAYTALVGTGSSITVSPTTTTTYYVRAEGTCNTTTGVSQAITVNTLSTAATSITGTSTICNGGGTTLSVSGGSLGTGAFWKWYSGSCGGTFIGTGSSITVSPTTTTTYYVRAEGTCNTTTCVSFAITVNDKPTIAAISSPAAICAGGLFSLSAPTVTTNGSAVTSQGWEFSSTSGGTYSAFANSNIPFSYNGYYLRYFATNSCGTTYTSPVQVTVNDKPTIAAISSPAAICAGGSFSLSAPTVTTNGSAVTSQGWEFSSTSGGTYSAFANSNIPFSYNGYYLRYFATNSCGTAYCGAVQITVNSSTSITAQSTAGQTQCIGSNFTAISVTASGSGTLSYQWYSNGSASTTGGTSLGSANGAQTNSYTPQSTTAGTLYYYCVVAGTCGTATSTASGAFDTKPNPVITIQPMEGLYCSGDNASFSVVATGSNLTYQWQTNYGGSSFQNLPEGSPYSGTNTSNLTINSVQKWMSDQNLKYMVVVNSGSCLVISSEVRIQVGQKPSIYDQPVNRIICEGSSTTFDVNSDGTAFQWEVSTDGGSHWNNVTNSTLYSGAKTRTLSIVNGTLDLNNYQYRVLISINTCSLYSSVVSLAVNPLPVISSNPIDLSSCTGNDALFSVSASGTGLTYQWQANGSGNWYNINDGSSYYNTNSSTLTLLKVETWQSGYKFRAIITNSFGCPVSSGGALLTVSPSQKPSIPSLIIGNNTPCPGEVGISYSVTDQPGANFTWSVPSGWTITSGQGTNSIIVKVGDYGQDGSISVFASNSCGTSGISSINVSVNLPTAITGPSTAVQTQCINGTFNAISVTATGAGTLSYQWYSNSAANSSGGISISGATNASCTPLATTAGTLYYYCVVSGTCGTATSTISGAFVTNALPIPTAGSNTQQCAGGTLNLNSSGGTSYSWIGPNGFSSISPNPSITNLTTTASGTYTVTVTNASGCVATATTNVTVNALPIPNLTSSDPDNIFCAGTSITFTAGGGTNYNFRVNGASVQNGTSNTYISSAITNGQVIDAIVTNALGCAAISNAITNTVNLLPTPTFINPSSSVCANDNVVYATQASQTNYAWNVPGVLNTDYTITSGGIGATNNTVILKWITSGSKTVTVNYTNTNGCTGTAAQTTTTVHPVPQIGSFN